MAIPTKIKSEATRIAFAQSPKDLSRLAGRLEEIVEECRSEDPESVKTAAAVVGRIVDALLEELGASDELKSFTADCIQQTASPS